MAQFMNNSRPTRKAMESAYARGSNNRRSWLENLPNEIKLMIIDLIVEPVSIFNLALTGPVFCDVVCTHEKKITRNAISARIPPELMYLAVANHMIATAPWYIKQKSYKTYGTTLKMPLRYATHLLDFAEQYRRPEELTLSRQYPRGVPLSETKTSFFELYEAVGYYAKKLPNHLSRDFKGQVPCAILARYERALYILQLVSRLFSWQGAVRSPRWWRTTEQNTEAFDRLQRAWGVFWYSLYPWEAEQVRYVQDSLYRHIVCPGGIWHNNMLTLSTGRFMTFMGPLGFWALEKEDRSPRPPSQPYFEFFRDKYKPGHFIGGAVCRPGFGRNLTIPRGIPQGDYKDLGPMELWLYVVTKRMYPFSSTLSLTSALIGDIVKEGRILWDRSGLNHMPRPPVTETLPLFLSSLNDPDAQHSAQHDLMRWWAASQTEHSYIDDERPEELAREAEQARHEGVRRIDNEIHNT